MAVAATHPRCGSEVNHEKIYLFDAGVFRRCGPRGRWTAPTGGWWLSTSGLGPRGEVDFVVYGELGLQAFEVKNTGRVHSSDLRALKAFREDYPEAEAALLYRGRDRLRIDDVWCLPVEGFLRRMTPDRALLASP